MPKQKKEKIAKINKQTSKPEKKAEKRSSKSEKIPSRVMGVKDFCGQEGLIFGLISAKISEFANLYSFKEIKVPVIENFDLFKKSNRSNNDKDFFFVDGDKGEKQVLRPEMTQGIVRAFIENNLIESGLPQRLFSMGPVFRKEKLQSGHYREFTQANFEIIGEKKAISEALFLTSIVNFLKDLGINVQIQINSLGDQLCRKEYASKLAAFFKERGKKTKLCTCCKNALSKNCLAMLDCKEEECVKLREEAPQIADFLSSESREYFTKILETLDEIGVNYNFNPYLVRGLSYYNDTVFEFWPINEEGNVSGKNSLAAGGRYDKFIEGFGGPETPAIGLALGLERILSKIKDKNALINKLEDDIIFIAQLGDQAKIKSIKLFEELREAGFKVRQSLTSDSLKIQLDDALAMRARTSLILGKKEIMDGTVLLRDMDSGAQETIIYKKIKERLLKMNKIVEKKINIRKEAGLYGGF